jgi:anti-sigma28 factor (negative regulator of flagellin synthesis)
MSEIATPTPTPTSSGDPGIVARLASQRTQFRQQRDTARVEADQLRTENTRLKGENTNLSTRADTSASAKRVAELEAQIRQGNHLKAFERLAKAKGATEGAYEDLYQLSGYRAERDEVDEAAIGALIDEQKARRPYLFGGKVEPGKTGDTSIVKPGAGGGQGKSHVDGPDFVQGPDDPRVNDVKWVMNNYDKVVASAKARMDRGEI